MKAGMVYDPIYLEHDTGDHVENSQRLVAAMSYLKETGIEEKLTCLPSRPALLEELAMIHTTEYISYVKSKAEKGGGWLDLDTVISQKSYEAALYAAGGLMVAVEAVMKEEADNAFAQVRPPGHHAIRDRAKGFCIFNNMAIAAGFALNKFSLNRILIADFDVHHGNGTQDAFYADPKILYFSTHQYPFYPGTGWVDETGTNEGKDEPEKYSIEYEVTFSKDELIFDRYNGYDILEIKEGNCINVIGKPRIPAKELKIALPAGMAVKQVQIVDVKNEILKGEYFIYPAQPPLKPNGEHKLETFVKPDEKIYSSKDPYPNTLVEFVFQTDLAGQGIAVIHFFPIQYIPYEKKIILNTKIVFNS